VLIPSLFTQLQSLREALQSQLGLAPSAIRDITTHPFTLERIPDAATAYQLLQSQPPRSTPYQARFQRLTSYNMSATVVQVLPTHDQALGGGKLLRQIRDLVAHQEPFASSEHGFFVVGDICTLDDAVDEVFAESPTIVGVTTLIVVFVVAGLAFKSLLIPVRLSATVLVTLILVAGSTILFYQFILGLDGIYWFVPICTSCLVIGLTIDYDVFLISRIYEFRHRGFSTEMSILQAMAKQSTTITTAGMIMTIAFSSLLFSESTVLNQFGFVLVAASIVDTFIVRTALVPALMFFAVETNWFPGKVPSPIRTQLSDLQDDSDSDSDDGGDSGTSMYSDIPAAHAAISV